MKVISKESWGKCLSWGWHDERYKDVGSIFIHALRLFFFSRTLLSYFLF